MSGLGTGTVRGGACCGLGTLAATWSLRCCGGRGRGEVQICDVGQRCSFANHATFGQPQGPTGSPGVPSHLEPSSPVPWPAVSWCDTGHTQLGREAAQLRNSAASPTPSTPSFLFQGLEHAWRCRSEPSWTGRILPSPSVLLAPPTERRCYWWDCGGNS